MPSTLFVCLGNICRSPLAEAAFRAEARRLDLDVEIETPKVTEAFNQQTRIVALEAGAEADIEVGQVDAGGSGRLH